MSTPPTLWLIEDDPAVRHGCRQTLLLADLPCRAFEDAETALAALRSETPDTVVCDVQLPGIDGQGLMSRLLKVDAEVPVILITGHGDITMAVQAIRAGAYDFIEKPFPPERLIEVVRRALDKRRLVCEVRQLREQVARQRGHAIVGQAPEIQQLRKLIAGLAPTSVDILLDGETGAGKEVAAATIHAQSGRSGPFVAINCGAIPDSVFESEMFGCEAGAFTGAVKRRIGKIEHAHGGTLFLDEIESLPLNLQVKLLRVLQERRIERLGGNTPIDVDCRVIAATKEDLKALAERGAFRADLYYRLNVAVLRLPPLRRRKEDIPLLMAHFLSESAQRYQRPVPQPAAADYLRWQAHDWPGNVRELRNTAERLCLGLGDELPDEPGGQAPNGDATSRGLVARLEEAEHGFLRSALHAARGQVAQAAETLQIPKKTLYDKLVRYALRAEDFRG